MMTVGIFLAADINILSMVSQANHAASLKKLLALVATTTAWEKGNVVTAFAWAKTTVHMTLWENDLSTLIKGQLKFLTAANNPANNIVGQASSVN